MEKNKVKIIVNGRFLTQKKTGVQNYAKGIVKALLKQGIKLEIVCPPGNYSQSDFPTKSIGVFRGFIWEQFFLPLYIRKQKGALLLNLCNTAPLVIKQQIITIHDLAFEETNNWFNPLFRAWYKFLIPRLCSKAAAILTVSEFTKRNILQKYKIDKDKISSAPPGIPEFKFQNNEFEKSDYVLLTGANNPRKNSDWVIKNIDILKNRNIKLIVLGEPSAAYNNISIPTNEFILYLHHVSFPEYCTLLKNALALIYPSLYEGFGIPVLESLCLGTPVIASDIPVLKESFESLPIYFKLGDALSFEKAINSLHERKISPENIEKLKNKFNFDFSATTIINVIKTIHAK